MVGTFNRPSSELEVTPGHHVVPVDAAVHSSALLGLYSERFYPQIEEGDVGSKCLLALNYYQALVPFSLKQSN